MDHEYNHALNIEASAPPMTLLQSGPTQVCLPCSISAATATAAAAHQKPQPNALAPKTPYRNQAKNAALDVVPTVELRVALMLDPTLRLGNDAPTKIQKRKRGGTKSTQKMTDKINKMDAKKMDLLPVASCSVNGCQLVGCVRIRNDASMQELYREMYASVCTNAHHSSHNEDLKFLLSMLHGCMAAITCSILEQRKALHGAMGGSCVWCRTIEGRHQWPTHDWFDTVVDGNSMCPEFDAWVMYLRMYVPSKSQYFFPPTEMGPEIDIHPLVFMQHFDANSDTLTLLNQI